MRRLLAFLWRQYRDWFTDAWLDEQIEINIIDPEKFREIIKKHL